jgi:DNA phosphorothioation-dependent restriction protein DptG
MDLSGLKWPVIIIVVVAIGWLASSGGVNWMVSNFSKATPGQDPKRDITDEAGLSKVGGYLMYLFKYEKAYEVMNLALQRYGNTGKNYWYNKYRMVKCLEKMARYQDAYNILRELEGYNAQQYDDRVPNTDVLRARAAKLKEVNGLQ